MLFITIGLSVLLVLLIIEREYLLNKNKELTELLETIFENEQMMANKLEEFEKQVTNKK